jgi:capsular exopolysaccharide synthesis family protein
MSKFFEALERAGTEQAIQTQASAPRAPADASAPPPPPAPSRETAPPASSFFKPPVVEPAARATELAANRTNRVGMHLVSLLNPRSFEAEQYRMLRHVVETLRKDTNLQVVAVTSPGVGEGKTTTAINLAGALAQSADAQVLLVDLDIRRPTVARQLGLAGSERSLVNTLLDSRLTLERTAEYLAHFNLSVLPAGGPVVAPYELLKSPRLGTLLEEGRQRYDYIVLDTPPFIPVPDCRLITKYVDGFLTVVAAHRTPRGMLAETLALMDPAKTVGLVFNGDAARRSSYYGAGYGTDTESPRTAGWRNAWRKP